MHSAESRISQSGKVAEYALATALIEREITPCFPATEHEPFDLMIWANNKPARLQVKGTIKSGKKVTLRMEYSRSRKLVPYTKDVVDFICVKVFSTGDWYFIPVEAIVSRTLTLFPYGESIDGYGKYKNAWHLLLGTAPEPPAQPNCYKILRNLYSGVEVQVLFWAPTFFLFQVLRRLNLHTSCGGCGGHALYVPITHRR